MIKAVLFDMDGVLVDSFDSWFKALNSVLSSQDKKVSKKEFREKYWGKDLRDILQEMGIDMTIGPFCNSVYTGHTDAIRIFSDTKKTLEELSAYKKGIITNTPEACTRQILKGFEIEKYFEAIVTADEVEHGKPDPDIVFKVCEKLQVAPAEVVLVGDTILDVKAGKSAGCTVVGVDVEADYTIDKLIELVDIVEGLK